MSPVCLCDDKYGLQNNPAVPVLDWQATGHFCMDHIPGAEPYPKTEILQRIFKGAKEDTDVGPMAAVYG
jgi:hypothetical protein